MQLGRGDYLVVVRADRLHPVELDVGYLRALLHVVHQHVLPALIHDVRAHVREESQPVNRLDVRVDRIRIERRTDLLRDVDSDRVFLDALITDYLNLGDYRLSLRTRDGRPEYRRDHQQYQRKFRGRYRSMQTA